MSESDIQREIVEELRLRGAVIFRMNAGRGKGWQLLCPPGTPDLLVIEPHHTWWCEVKTPTGKLTDDQVAMHERLEMMGHEVVVARSVEDIA